MINIPLLAKSSAAKFKLLVLCCLILTLSGCTLRVVYHFLDWGLQWKLQHYLSLTRDQRAFAKSAIGDFHHWHQRHELPRYLEYLNYLQKRLAEGHLTADDLHEESDKIQLLTDASVDKLMPAITDLFSTLSDAQLKDLAKTLEQDRKDYAKQYLTPSAKDIQERLVSDLKSYLEPNLGKLTKEQNQWVTQWSQQLLPFGKLVIKQQEIWATTLIQNLAHRSDKVLLAKELRELLLYRTDNWEAEARQVTRANEQLSLELIAKILNNLSEKQRETLNDNLEIYQQDCRQLIADVGL